MLVPVCSALSTEHTWKYRVQREYDATQTFCWSCILHWAVDRGEGVKSWNPLPLINLQYRNFVHDIQLFIIRSMNLTFRLLHWNSFLKLAGQKKSWKIYREKLTLWGTWNMKISLSYWTPLKHPRRYSTEEVSRNWIVFISTIKNCLFNK